MSEKNVEVKVIGLDRAALGIGKTAHIFPGAVARGLNETVERTRARLVEQAEERYAVNAAGRRHLDDLKMKERATSARLTAGMRIKKMRNDLGYFESKPNVPMPGDAWRRAPQYGFFGHVLKSTAMKNLGGGTAPGLGAVGKGFLAHFKSGHVGMVQRLLGSSSQQTVTARGRPRWKSRNGKIEKLVTVGSPSAAAMINTVWPGRDVESAEYFMEQLEKTMKGELK